MKSLIAIFSYNRKALLENALSSVQRHIPNADILIVDDCSDAPGMQDWLALAGAMPQVTVLVKGDAISRDVDRLGGLYNNMNHALSWAQEQGYELMLFMQDDQQLVWPGDNLLENTADFLKRVPTALMLDPRFTRRVRYVGSYEYVESLGQYRTRRGCVAVGFVLPGKLKEIGFRFGNSERESSQLALDLGMRTFSRVLPVLADIPITHTGGVLATWKGRLSFPSAVSDGVSPLVKDLDDLKIEKMTSRDPTVMPFSEDYIHYTDPHDVVYPYWFNAKQIDRFCELALECRRVELSAGMAPCKVPVVASEIDAGHLDIAGSAPTAAKKRQQPVARPAGRLNTKYVKTRLKTLWFFLFQYSAIKQHFRR